MEILKFIRQINDCVIYRQFIRLPDDRIETIEYQRLLDQLYCLDMWSVPPELKECVVDNYNCENDSIYGDY